MVEKESKQGPELFEKIDKSSIVKAGDNGYWYCQTIPPHPFGEIRSDRKARYVYLHRAILEKKLGRYLLKNEQADHKDGDKNNNNSANVQLIVLGEHQKDHVDRGNHFWKKSPRNKKRANEELSRMTYRVIKAYLS
jgi:hypothetical protein